MPTYSRFCPSCELLFTRWQSIHDDSPMLCEACGSRSINVVEKVATYAVGSRGERTASADATEQVWSKDMAAYKRFRDKGLQPRQITGADHLEATAVGTWHVETGQRHKDEVVASRTEDARAIVRGQL